MNEIKTGEKLSKIKPMLVTLLLPGIRENKQK